MDFVMISSIHCATTVLPLSGHISTRFPRGICIPRRARATWQFGTRLDLARSISLAQTTLGLKSKKPARDWVWLSGAGTPWHRGCGSRGEKPGLYFGAFCQGLFGLSLLDPTFRRCSELNHQKLFTFRGADLATGSFCRLKRALATPERARVFPDIFKRFLWRKTPLLEWFQRETKRSHHFRGVGTQPKEKLLVYFESKLNVRNPISPGACAYKSQPKLTTRGPQVKFADT